MEAATSRSISAVVAKRMVMQQIDGWNTSSSSCDASLQDDIPSADILPALLITAPTMLVPPMTELPEPEPTMAALPITAPPMLPPWSIHLPSYPQGDLQILL
jgi:hypothetical protein